MSGEQDAGRLLLCVGDCSSITGFLKNKGVNALYLLVKKGILTMFVRKKKYPSGNIGVIVVEKIGGKMKELATIGVAYNEDIKVGIMIETPAASLMADVFAKEADFFSIGTNDLTGYTMAVDRGNAEVAYLYSAYNPAVLRSIERVIKAGRAEGIMVGMCGEAAADPLLAPLLISFGMNEFSVSATSILATRKGISLWTKEEADAVAAKAMSLTTEAEVEAYLKSVAKH